INRYPRHEVHDAADSLMDGAAVDLDRPKVIEQARPRRRAAAIEADGNDLLVILLGLAPGSAERDEAHLVIERHDRVERADRVGVFDLELAVRAHLVGAESGPPR